jgi:hypothetical protein
MDITERSRKMHSSTDFETAPCTPIIGDIEDGIPDDLDAQLEDECLDSVWAV